MPLVAWVTLVIGFLIIAAAALGLIRVIGHLTATLKALRVVAAEVDTIASRTAGVPVVLDSVNTSLKPVRDFCESI